MGPTGTKVTRNNEDRKDACAPQKIDPALIARFRAAMLGCFVPVDPTTPPAS